MWLSEIKSPDLKRNQKYVFLVSLGSLEQHGPYGPLGTDTYTQNALLQKVESQLPKIIFLPTIPITRSKEHVGFSGTVSLESETLYMILKDVVNSLQSNAKAVLFVSWHGGNKSVIVDFIQKEQSHYSEVLLAHPTFGDESTDEVVENLLQGPPDVHAGNTELSIMKSIRPDLTGTPKNEEQKQNIDYSWDKPMIQVTSEGVIDSHPSWVVDAEIGQKLLDIYSENLIKKILSLKLG